MEIDVSKCRRYMSIDGCCLASYEENELGGSWEFCKDNPNCYYKQLQQLKQENEELKKVIYDALDDFNGEYGTDEYDRLLVRASRLKIDISDFGEILYGKE